jgi:hypothetical protein
MDADGWEYELNITIRHGQNHHGSCEKRIPYLVVASPINSHYVTELFYISLLFDIPDFSLDI